MFILSYLPPCLPPPPPPPNLLLLLQIYVSSAQHIHGHVLYPGYFMSPASSYSINVLTVSCLIIKGWLYFSQVRHHAITPIFSPSQRTS